MNVYHVVTLKSASLYETTNPLTPPILSPSGAGRQQARGQEAPHRREPRAEEAGRDGADAADEAGARQRRVGAD